MAEVVGNEMEHSGIVLVFTTDIYNRFIQQNHNRFSVAHLQLQLSFVFANISDFLLQGHNDIDRLLCETLCRVFMNLQTPVDNAEADVNLDKLALL